MKKIVRKFKSKTHPFVRALQWVLLAISASIMYYGGLPEELKGAIPVKLVNYVAYSGFVLTFLLQFTEKKSKK